MEPVPTPPFTDEDWMKLALSQAHEAALAGEVPVGAIIVRENRPVAFGYNRTITDMDPSAHAEIIAIRQAALLLGNHRLLDCDLYVTLEPCAMCVGACAQARIRRLCYGTSDPKWGCLGSKLDLSVPGLFNHTIQVVGNILEAECRQPLQAFFQARRPFNRQ